MTTIRLVPSSPSSYLFSSATPSGHHLSFSGSSTQRAMARKGRWESCASCRCIWTEGRRGRSWAPPGPMADKRHGSCLFVKVKCITAGSWAGRTEVWGPGPALLPLCPVTDLEQAPPHPLLGLFPQFIPSFIMKLNFLHSLGKWSIHPSIHPSTHSPYTHSSTHLYIHPPCIYPYIIYQSIPPIHLSIHPFIHSSISIHPSIHPSKTINHLACVTLSARHWRIKGNKTGKKPTPSLSDTLRAVWGEIIV